VFGLDSDMIRDASIISSFLPVYMLISALALRRVLHLKMVTQCSMLEDFGIFLVLADKVRLVNSEI